MIDYEICNCIDGMKKLDTESVDLLVTDPPYGIEFMGHDWDKVVPSVEIWKDCLRVMKSGSFAFIMSSPRQDVYSRMICNLQDAGFETGFSSLFWTYATGMPKALNISKAIDKRLGAKREIIETVEYERKNDASFAWQDGENRSTAFKSGKHEYAITKPSSDLAKQYDGAYAGYQPKPAVEPIIVVMKPLSEKSYIDQCLKNGKGITWLGNCKIPNNEINDLKIKNQKLTSTTDEGRFPSNLICSDDILNNGIITKSVSHKPRKCKNPTGNTYMIDKPTGKEHNDKGSYSRYFDIDAWWNQKLSTLPSEVAKTFPYFIIPKPSKKEKNEDLPKELINIHPTVKPLKLFSYLITLGSQKDDTILDPFVGSGTTLRASKLLNRNAIGFEQNPEFEEIIKYRAKMNEKPLTEFF